MADKRKGSKGDAGVMASLPATRPSRLSRRARGGANGSPEKPQPATARPTPAAASPAPPQPRPRAVSAGAPTLAESNAKAEENREPASSRAPTGTELVTTVFHAAGELAQIGVTVSGQILKRTLGRFPRP